MLDEVITKPSQCGGGARALPLFFCALSFSTI
jgi:hypothetical protein